uniref:RRM domain-containing protein n=2 Tax=Oryza TaxID=4527 RepID=A0A0D3GXZ4_9ORYZ
MGFALFSSAHHAIAAKAALQDLVFDAETKTALHTEMAKKNLFVKRGVGNDANAMDQSKRLRTGGDYTHSPYAAPPYHPPPPAVSMWGTPGYIAAPPPYNHYAAYSVPPVAMTSPSPVPGPTAYAPVQTLLPLPILYNFSSSSLKNNQNTKDNPPCNTLFIGNLGETVIEEELRSLFSVQPGYKQMKVLRQDRNTVCFIEFEDVNAASAVHHNLQGAVIPSSGRGGMRIQYPLFAQ